MAGIASVQNGKKGGRPKGSKASHTLQAEQGRKIVIAIIAKNLKPLIQAMVEKAKKGDTQAFKELFDRGWGKSPQPVTGEGGVGPISVQISETVAKKNGLTNV